MLWSADALAAAALLATTGLALGAAWLRPVARSERVAREGGTVFLGEALMHRAYGLARPLVRALAAARVSPDALSWASLAAGVAAGVAAGCGRLGFAAWLFALSGLGDLLDGAVARERGCASASGAVLDSVLDRYVEAFFLGGLLVWFSERTGLQLLCLVALLGSFMVTYSTAKAEALGVEPPRGWMKRPERLVWLIYGAALASLLGALAGSGSPLAAEIGAAAQAPQAVQASPAGGAASAAVAQMAMGCVLGLIALFSHLSAWRRLRALQVTAMRRVSPTPSPSAGADRSNRPRPGASPDS